MEKRYGAAGRDDRLMQIGRSKWELIYGYGTDGTTGWNWRTRYKYKPTAEEIKAAVTEQINSNVTEKIIGGMTYNGQAVWLSTENQLNYASIERNADVEYPLTLKMNEEADGTPVYHTFGNAEEFAAFSKAASLHILQCVKDGWQEKDSVDWSKFEVK